jgi:hypothetical protein
MGSKLKPGRWDCYANAEPDEPMFILLARDSSAPTMVRMWAARRIKAIEVGEKPKDDEQQITEALDLADAMEAWRKEHR